MIKPKRRINDIRRTSGGALSDNNDKKINKPAQKGKSWLKKMIEIIKTDNFLMLLLVLLGYVTYKLYFSIQENACTKLSLACSVPAAILVIVFGVFLYLLMLLMKIMAADADVELDTKKLVKRKLELEIAKLEKK